jgi:Domain of unknown function (DUF4405)
MVRTPFHWRSFISLLTTLIFLVMIFTSLAVYIDPSGRIAMWIDWRFLGLDKEAWSSLHTIIGTAFLVVGFIHVLYNWKPLKAYVVEHAHGLAQVRLREGVAAGAASVMILVGSVAGWPPFVYLDDLTTTLEARWAAIPGSEPPLPHAESLSIEALGKLLDFDPARAVASLAKDGIAGVDPKDLLSAVALKAERSAAEVYGVIAAGEKAVRAQEPAKVWTPEELDTRYGGTGVGRRSIIQLADEFSLPREIVITRLAAIGVAARGEDRLKDLAERIGLDAMELFKAALIEGYLPPKP